MSGKTRLDEIVEEYSISLDTDDRKSAMAIAERAFRHGVERGVHAAIQNHPSFTMFDSVQPAPAATDPHDEDTAAGVKAERERRTAEAKQRLYEPGHLGAVDRRKGERRKGLEFRIGGFFHTCTRTNNGWAASSSKDRRSGEERRK